MTPEPTPENALLAWALLCPAMAALVAVRVRLGASIAFLLAAFDLLPLTAAITAVLAGQMLEAFLAHQQASRAGASPRVIGSGIHARSPRLWRNELTRRPFMLAMGSRFVPDGSRALWMALASVRDLPIGSRVAAVLGAVAGSLALTVLWATITMGLADLLLPPEPDAAPLHALAVALALIALDPRVVALLLTPTGRSVLAAWIARWLEREYWPTWLVYAMIAPEYVRLGLRYSPAAFTACNPGIPGAGGMIGERKSHILRALDAATDAVLPWALLPNHPDPAHRADLARRLIHARPELGGYPIILKPDDGYRGHGVTLIRDPDQLLPAIARLPVDAILQRYHPGPKECGVLWVRRTDDPAKGRIYSITGKQFPTVIGDGVRTIEQLIWSTPRLARQAGVFLERLADRRDEVPDAGRRVSLGVAGNHCQGTLFTDAAHLITPELTAAIDRIAQAFPGPDGAPGGLDVGRFDLRYTTDAHLRQGRGFAIVELNGTSSEPTNMYDPSRSLPWMWATLAGLWRDMYALGHRRARAGRPTVSLFELIRRDARAVRARVGSSVAD